MSEALPFERVMTYSEWVEDEPEPSNPPRLDVACPQCAGLARIVDDDVRVGHWYLACPCGWDEFR
jgi:hypothetical protein